MIYITITDIPELKLKNINNIKLNKEFLVVKDEKSKFSYQLLPLSVNTNYYGRLIIGGERITYLTNINRAKGILIHKEVRDENIDSMYLYKDEYIIVNQKIDDNTFTRDLYDAITGKYKE